MKKEFDLKIDGGTLESIKIDSSNSLIIATYTRDVDEFKAGDILIDAYDEDGAKFISILKDINEDKGGIFSAHLIFDISDNCMIFDSSNWDHTEYNRLATDEEKQLLFNALKKEGKRWNAEKLEIEELEKLDISEIVVDYESAIKYLGIKDTLLVFKNYDRVEKFNAQIKLQLIAEAWNKFDEFEADWENYDQYKYCPAFRVRGGNIEFSHTSFTNGLWGITRGALDFHTSNFSFKSEERARQFGEQFIDLFKVALGF